MPEFYNRFQGRPDLIAYASENGIPVPVTTKSPWSMDANLMHVSYESGVLEDPSTPAPDDLYQMTTAPEKAPNDATLIKIRFDKGTPTEVQNLDSSEVFTDSLELFQYLNFIGYVQYAIEFHTIHLCFTLVFPLLWSFSRGWENLKRASAISKFTAYRVA